MLIHVQVKAGARIRKLEQLTATTYKVWTTVVPEDGKANMDVRDILSEHLGVAKSLIALVKGSTTSKKTYKISA